MSKLPIIKTDKKSHAPPPGSPNALRQQVEAKFERMWLIDPEQFNPFRTIDGRMRIERLEKLFPELQDKRVVDLGCGWGALSEFMQRRGAKVESLDIASNALKRLEGKDLKLTQDFVPYSKLEDGLFDLVVCTDLIAYLPQEEFRLFFSELSRLIKKDGKVICSTPLDVYSDGAVSIFASYAETEFIVEKWDLSYNMLQIKLLHFFEWPEKLPSIFLPLKWLSRPFAYILKNSRFVIKGLETVTRFFWPDSGMSYAAFIGRRRPFFEPPSPDSYPEERKAKKMVWE